LIPGYRLKYKFKHKITADAFLNWSDDDVQDIEVGTPRKLPNQDKTKMCWQTFQIPVLYVHLIGQLEAEKDHGNHNKGYEAVRRQTYAKEVLAEFAKEIRRYKGEPSDFHSRVLTPILQRHFRGVPDNHTPLIRSAIAGGSTDPTIAQTTEFYLGTDPISALKIPFYRQNLLYIVESRWYLGILLGNISVRSVANFNRVRRNHDLVMEDFEAEEANAHRSEESVGGSQDSPYTLTAIEVGVIKDEGLEDFFKKELLRTVRTSALSPAIPNPVALQEEFEKADDAKSTMDEEEPGKRRLSEGSDDAKSTTDEEEPGKRRLSEGSDPEVPAKKCRSTIGPEDKNGQEEDVPNQDDV
jgi:hypothetical protein